MLTCGSEMEVAGELRNYESQAHPRTADPGLQVAPRILVYMCVSICVCTHMCMYVNLCMEVES